MTPLTILSTLETELIEYIRSSVLRPHLNDVAALPEADGADLVKKFSASAPGVYVVFKSVSVNGTLDVQFNLAAITRNAGGFEKAMHGDKTAIGLYELVITLVALFNDQSTGEGLWRLRSDVAPIRGSLMSKANLYGAVIPLSTDLSLPGAIVESDLDPFVTFHSDLDIPPHETAAEHGKWTAEPPDLSTSVPDAQDDIQLEQP